MTSTREQLAEFSALLQVYLMQQHDRKEWLLADPETHRYFKQQVQIKLPLPSAPITDNAARVPLPVVVERSVPIQQKPIPPITTKEPVIAKEGQKEPVALEEKKAVPLLSKEPMAKTKDFFVPEPLAIASHADLSDIRTIMAEKFPGIQILDHLPKEKDRFDSEAIPGVIVLSFQENSGHRAFLQQVAFAIQRSLGTAGLWDAEEIEKRQGWDSLLSASKLRLIVAGAHGMHRYPQLMQHYREVNKGGRIYFGKVPALLLADLSIYMKEPQLKATLWKALKESLKPQ